MNDDRREREGVEEERVRLCDEELFRLSSYISNNSNSKLWILIVRTFLFESRTGKSSKNHARTPEAMVPRIIQG